MTARPFVKPRALRPGARVALLPLASPSRDADVAAAADELAVLGFEPVIGVRPEGGAPYVAGAAASRAARLQQALRDPAIAAVVAMRGGYGSAQLLPWLDLAAIRDARTLLIGYSDLTALIDTIAGHAGLVTVHGPMAEGRLCAGADAYDRDSFMRVVCDTRPFGAVPTDTATVLRPGRASGVLRGGTLTQLAAMLGTPWGWRADEDTILFLDEVHERPYRVDRLLWQLRHAGVLAHVRGIVVNELPGCDEPGGVVTGLDAVRHALEDFSGPVAAGVRSGHTSGPMLTLPLGVRVRLDAGDRVAFAIEEAAVA